LRALGIDPSVVHLNEGHASFASLALARAAVAAGASFDEAVEQVRRRRIFTTHTPVPAGNDTYPAHEVLENFGQLIGEPCVDPGTWAGVDAIPDEELWAVRQEQRRWLVELVREQSLLERAGRGEPRDYVQSAARAFDPQALTLGFARRLATYKRLHLLLLDVGRALALIAGDRPVQIVLAGKAHPRDDQGKRLVQNLFAVRDAPWVGERVVFIEDYDLSIGSRLVRGCDVWVNVPRPPLEASGTSGMKNVMNGGLQLSVLDGWWAEGFDGSNGWGFSGEEDHDHGAQDH